ncbi:MAG TPA: UrcA family protein [Steroidobacteraceae bacterium]|nr:UrcA family protein [Steroidobacteraceae bacterium]
MSSNVKTLSRVPLAFATALLLAGGVISTAHATEPVRSETVKFADLNVDSPAGVQALYDRIHAAAKRVCSSYDPFQQIAAGSCTRKAEARAIEKLSLPQLTAFYQTKTSGQPQPLIANR